ncbi:MAG: YggS family pyridoxal phosphate-dependent enzyme [Desulfovibrionaceae bacterium]|nr:YggS family pyridoxal phosphate-dependent enzyme [Desulfovibrionaceae bacterium]
MQDAAALRERWEAVRRRLADAVRAAGRAEEEVTLVAVSKLHPVESMACLAAWGQVDFGENYVQEARAKQGALSGNPECVAMRWHCIGHVQSRKARDVAGRFALIHSLDSLKLAVGLEKHLESSGTRQPVLIQVNIGGEVRKSGAAVEELPALAEGVMGLPHLELQGLMCLPPIFDDGPAARPHFARLRGLRDDLERRLGCTLPHLSMGMSGDFEEAVAEGATLVRIGTDIFGPRPARHMN